MLYAYWLEDHPEYGPRVQAIHQGMKRRRDLLFTSTFVLAELLVGPVKTKNDAAAGAIESFFASDAVISLPFSVQSARIFARLRTLDGVKPLDALHLSVAASVQVDLFITNDRRLHHLSVPGIRFIASLETGLY